MRCLFTVLLLCGTSYGQAYVDLVKVGASQVASASTEAEAKSGSQTDTDLEGPTSVTYTSFGFGPYVSEETREVLATDPITGTTASAKGLASAFGWILGANDHPDLTASINGDPWAEVIVGTQPPQQGANATADAKSQYVADATYKVDGSTYGQGPFTIDATFHVWGNHAPDRATILNVSAYVESVYLTADYYTTLGDWSVVVLDPYGNGFDDWVSGTDIDFTYLATIPNLSSDTNFNARAHSSMNEYKVRAAVHETGVPIEEIGSIENTNQVRIRVR